jgi:hypothetical protein
MGWDAGLNRKLAVPLAVRGLSMRGENSATKTRKLRNADEDPLDLETIRKLAETRERIEKLVEEFSGDPEIVDSAETESELDYVEASIQLGLLEITGELEETPHSDELFEEAVA